MPHKTDYYITFFSYWKILMSEELTTHQLIIPIKIVRHAGMTY